MSTKTNERRLNITPGTWSTTQVVYDNYPAVQVFAPFYGEAVHWRKPKAGHTRAERDQQNADAELIADAGATANEVDLLPSELLAKLREAEKTIADLEATCHQMAHTITTFDNPDPSHEHPQAIRE